MKRITIICLAFAIGGFQLVIAQDTSMNELAIIQEQWGMAKKEVVGAFLDLNETEAAAFWPVYDSYDVARKELGKERYGIIEDYANAYENISDEQAIDLTNRAFKNNIAIEKLQMQYYKKMTKVVSPVEASKFMQLEKYMETVIKAQLKGQIPLIGEMEGARN